MDFSWYFIFILFENEIGEERFFSVIEGKSLSIDLSLANVSLTPTTLAFLECQLSDYSKLSPADFRWHYQKLSRTLSMVIVFCVCIVVNLQSYIALLNI